MVIVLAPITIGVILAAIYLASPRFGLHYTSRLVCPKCGKTFDYEWLPGGSFTALRLGTKRYMRCPLCRKWSIFNVVSTIVKPEDDNEGDDGKLSEGN
jgi:DNA-directed RNA polymerase subunit RPC12/RpoP